MTGHVKSEPQQIAELEKEVGVLRKRGEERERELEALREELAKVRKEIEEWKRGFRERGKRRTSRTEGKRARSGKPLGRKAGHPGAWAKEPERVDDEVFHPVPAASRRACGRQKAGRRVARP